MTRVGGYDSLMDAYATAEADPEYSAYTVKTSKDQSNLLLLLGFCGLRFSKNYFRANLDD